MIKEYNEGDIIEKTYSTSRIAGIIGIHPNTVRMYEDLELIPKPQRRENGYRVFTDVHIDQFKLARTALMTEVLQSGLRKRIIEVIKLSARGLYDEALTQTRAYIDIVEAEIVNANEAVDITNELLKSSYQKENIHLRRKEVSDLLGITMDTLRNWEMNGLLKVKRRENGYRVYDSEDIVSVCDRLIISLNTAKKNAEQIIYMLADMKRKYQNPTF